MIVKMLTHVHMLVYTLWYSALFEKMKCMFSIAPVGNLEKSRECSSLRNTHRTLAVEASDAEAMHPVCCGAHWMQGDSCSCVRCYLTSAEVFVWKHRTLRERPVVCIRWPARFADLSVFKTGVHRTRPMPTCSGSGALQVTVRL